MYRFGFTYLKDIYSMESGEFDVPSRLTALPSDCVWKWEVKEGYQLPCTCLEMKSLLETKLRLNRLNARVRQFSWWVERVNLNSSPNLISFWKKEVKHEEECVFSSWLKNVQVQCKAHFRFLLPLAVKELKDKLNSNLL